MKTTKHMTIEDLRNAEQTIIINEEESAQRAALEDPFGTQDKVVNASMYVSIVDTKEEIVEWYQDAHKLMIKKLEAYSNNAELQRELSFVQVPFMKVAQDILNDELSTEEGIEKVAGHCMRLGSVLVTKGKIASADAIETGVRVLAEYYHGTPTTDLEFKYKMVEHISSQLIELMQDVVLKAFSDTSYITDAHGHSHKKEHWYEKVLMPVRVETLYKKLDVRNLPLFSRDLQENKVKDITRGKTFFHRELQHSTMLCEYLDYIQKFEFTIGKMGTTDKELDAWLEARADWIDISAEPTDKKPNYRYEGRFIYKFRTINKIQSYVGKSFHLKGGFEGRGRTKYQATSLGLNPLGDSYETAMLELYHKRIITDKGGYQLSLLISTEMFGRVSERKNAKAFKDNWDKGLMWKDNCPTDLYSRKLWKAYADYKDSIASGFIARIDGTNSGLQFISTGIADEDGAKYSNIAGHKEVYDAYGLIAGKLNLELKLKKNLLTRNELKDGFTVTMYGAGAWSAVTNFRGIDKSKLVRGEFYIPHKPELGQHASLYEELMDRPELAKFNNTDKISKKEPYTRRQKRIMEAFTTAFEQAFPGVAEAIDTIISAYGHSVNKLGHLQHDWTLPDGFVAQSVNYAEGETNTVKYVTKRKKDKNKYRVGSHKVMRNAPSNKARIRSLFANLTHSLDGYALREVSKRLGNPILTKHDDFGVHPNDIVDLKELYALVVWEIADEQLLQKLLTDALDVGDGRTIYATLDRGNLKIANIKNSMNALR